MKGGRYVGGGVLNERDGDFSFFSSHKHTHTLMLILILSHTLSLSNPSIYLQKDIHTLKQAPFIFQICCVFVIIPHKIKKAGRC